MGLAKTVRLARFARLSVLSAPAQPGLSPATDNARRMLRLRALTPASALLPLRLFLGLTFVYGGMQKLSDPGFLHPGAPTYIGAQLRGFAGGTPGGFILHAFALPFPRLAGVGVALVEIAVGLLVTAGLLTRAAAMAGLALNLLLFLTASWKTSPYFLGSDIVFVFAWLPFVLAGANGQPALDRRLHELASRRRGRARPFPSEAGRAVARLAPAPAGLTRRTVMRQALALTGLATGVLAGVAAAAAGRYRGGTVVRSLASGSAPATPAAPSHPPLEVHHHRPGGRPAAAPPAGAVRIGPSRGVGAGQAATYRDPHDGQADILVRDRSGGLTALSAICTHAGCAVSYQGGALYCPCHGSVFNARTGAVQQGPANQPLAQKKVIERGGSIYAMPS